MVSVSLASLATPETVNADSSAERVARIVDRLISPPCPWASPEGGKGVRQHPGEYTGTLLVGNGFELVGVQPHAAAVGAGLDLDAMVRAANQIVPVFGALHEVRLTLSVDCGRLSPVPLFPQQLGVFAGEIFVFVPTRFIRLHCWRSSY
jgi:hypothetical protein